MISTNKIEGIVRHIANKNGVKVSNAGIKIEPSKNDCDIINWVTINITTNKAVSERVEKRIQVGIDRYFYKPSTVRKHYMVAMIDFFTE